MLTRARWQKLQFFKIQDGGRPPFWKSLNRHISVENRPILMKFGTLYQTLNMVAVTWPNIEILKIQDGSGRHLEIRFFGHKSSTDCPISAKFRTRKQNGRSTRAIWQKLQIYKKNPTWWTAAILKIVKSPYLSEISSNFDEIWYTTLDIYWTRLQSCDQKLKFLKFKIAAASILKFAFLDITRRLIVRFQRNFVWGSRTAGRQGLHDNNCKFLKSKMADRRHFVNRSIAISEWKIVRFWWNLVHCIRYWTRLQSRDQKLQFLKFKIAAAAILKIAYLAITH